MEFQEEEKEKKGIRNEEKTLLLGYKQIRYGSRVKRNENSTVQFSHVVPLRSYPQR